MVTARRSTAERTEMALGATYRWHRTRNSRTSPGSSWLSDVIAASEVRQRTGPGPVQAALASGLRARLTLEITQQLLTEPMVAWLMQCMTPGHARSGGEQIVAIIFIIR